MMAQSPRLSVTAQISLTRLELRSEIWSAAAVKEGFGGLANIAGEYDQELAAAAGAQQDARQAEFGEEGAGQDFAEQSDPLRLAGE